MKKIIKAVKVNGGFLVTTAGGTVFMTQSAFAALPTEMTTLFTQAGADGLLAVGACIGAYTVYRGAIAAFTIGKRMLSKAGF